MQRQINVMIVDDSIFMRKILTAIVESDLELKVVATAKNGEEAISLLKSIQVDVITMDINMPRMDGLTALKHIMASNPVPVIMISSLTQEGAQETFTALSNGAVDFVAKASGSISFDIDKQRDEIVHKIKSAATSKLRRVTVPTQAVQPATAAASHFESPSAPKGVLSKRGDVVIAIGTSTGGPTTLFEIIPLLPKELNAPVFLVQHMPALFTKTFAQRLNDSSQIAVKEVEDNEFVEKSKVYLAKGNAQMIVKKESGTDRRVLNIDYQMPSIYKPNVNIAFDSIVEAYAPNIIGVILTGMGDDGAEGILNIKKSGGVTIAESEATSIIFGMPKEAIKTGGVDYVLPSTEIAQKIISLLGVRG